MVYKTVIRLDMKGCDKCKKMALQSVAKIEGIDSLSINMEDSTLTVIGEADPVFVANMLRRKFRCAQIVSAQPMPSHPKEEGKPTPTPKPKPKPEPKPDTPPPPPPPPPPEPEWSPNGGSPKDDNPPPNGSPTSPKYR